MTSEAKKAPKTGGEEAKETKEPKDSKAKDTKDTEFTCRFCGRKCSIGEMKAIYRFSPPLMACADCEKRLA
jgi:hypothetical protein